MKILCGHGAFNPSWYVQVFLGKLPIFTFKFHIILGFKKQQKSMKFYVLHTLAPRRFPKYKCFKTKGVSVERICCLHELFTVPFVAEWQVLPIIIFFSGRLEFAFTRFFKLYPSRGCVCFFLFTGVIAILP
jgi:hypothetical protein